MRVLQTAPVLLALWAAAMGAAVLVAAPTVVSYLSAVTALHGLAFLRRAPEERPRRRRGARVGP
ncbi:hypothetical protein AB1484_25010 [Parafrankia sp. FMc6]|uniref:hypothetical protein n=1 Tax=Parafrankia soli TaxID=2599596 RepID=UPI0034D5E80B